MYRNLVQPLLLLLGLQLVAAQFDFFGNMFGGQQQHHQQQQHRSGASQWAAYSDSVSCSSYLCPETLDCVAKPVDCPCPNSEDIKCLIPDDGGGVDDATVVCARGDKECAEVQRLMLKGGTKSKSSKSKSKSKTKSGSRK